MAASKIVCNIRSGDPELPATQAEKSATE